MKSLQFVQDYWKSPDEQNDPLKYIDGQIKTGFLCNQISKLEIRKNDFILELGCNIGRNLNGLVSAGYKFVKGIELNYDCKKITDNIYSKLKAIIIYYGNIDKLLLTYPANSDKLVFTMAVLCHIHPDVQEIVFDNMARVTDKYIITIEDEVKISDRHYPRNYKQVFESRDMREIESSSCAGIKGLGKHYVYRCFEK